MLLTDAVPTTPSSPSPPPNAYTCYSNDDCQCSKPTKDIRANRVLPFWNEQAARVRHVESDRRYYYFSTLLSHGVPHRRKRSPGTSSRWIITNGRSESRRHPRSRSCGVLCNNVWDTLNKISTRLYSAVTHVLRLFLLRDRTGTHASWLSLSCASDAKRDGASTASRRATATGRGHPAVEHHVAAVAASPLHMQPRAPMAPPRARPALHWYPSASPRAAPLPPPPYPLPRCR